MTRTALIIFDCDGVLVDSERISHTVLRQMLAEVGVQLTLQEALDRFMGASTAKGLALMEGLMGRSAPLAFLAELRERTFEAFGTELTAVPGVLDMLVSLDLPSCVASNGSREKMNFTLHRTGLLHHFADRMFSADEVARPKPAPDLFLHAAAAMKTAAQACVVVEDSATGVAAAKAAGMRVYGYAAMGQAAKLHAAGADRVFADMAEVGSALRGSTPDR